MAATGREAQAKEYAAAQDRNRKYAEAIGQAQARLNVLYRQRIAPEAMRERKQAEFAALKLALAGSPRYRDVEPNNAFLASFATYTELVNEFEYILKENNGDLERFYAQVRRYAASEPSNRGPLSARSR
jgi:predicted aminopeptidase